MANNLDYANVEFLTSRKDYKKYRHDFNKFMFNKTKHKSKKTLLQILFIMF